MAVNGDLVSRLGLHGGPSAPHGLFTGRTESVTANEEVHFLARDTNIIFYNRSINVRFGDRDNNVDFHRKF